MTENPFFDTWTTPFGLPPFDRIRPEHFPPAFDKGMAEQNAEIAAITGAATQIAVWALCIGIGAQYGGTTPDGAVPENGPLNKACLSFSFLTWIITGLAVNDAILGIQLAGTVWIGIVGYALVNLGFGAAFPTLSAWILARMPGIISAIISPIGNFFATLRAWFSGPAGAGFRDTVGESRD